MSVSAFTGSPPVHAMASPGAPGDVRWMARYDGPSHLGDSGASLAVSSDGRTVFVTGDSFDNTDEGWVTTAYNASTGHRRWTTHYRSAYPPSATAASPDRTAV